MPAQGTVVRKRRPDIAEVVLRAEAVLSRGPMLVILDLYNGLPLQFEHFRFWAFGPHTQLSDRAQAAVAEWKLHDERVRRHLDMYTELTMRELLERIRTRRSARLGLAG